MVTRRQLIIAAGGAAIALAAGGTALLLRGGAKPQEGKIGGKLVVAARSGYHEEINRNLIDTFLKEYPNVEVEYIGKGYGDLYQLLVLALSAKSRDYDALYIDEPWLPMMVKNGWLLPIEDPDLEGYPEHLRKWPTIGGKTYGQAITGNANFLFYREDILRDLGESKPETWDDVLRIAKKVKEKYTDIGVKIYGFGCYASKGEPMAADTFPGFLYPFGGRYFANDNITPALDSKEAVEALEFFKSLLPYSHPRITEFTTLAEYSEAILRGEIAMGLVWNGWIKDIDDPVRSAVVGKINIMPYPRQKVFFGAQSGIWFYSVSAFSQNVNTAMKFVKLVTSFPAQLRAAIEAGLPPSRLQVFKHPDYKAKQRLADKYYEIMEVTKPVRTSPFWQDMAETLGKYLIEGLLGRMPAEEAIRRAHQEMVNATRA